MKDTVVVVGEQPTVQARANEVRKQLTSLREHIEDNFFDLCDLLAEAHAGDYHNVFGYSKFGDWIEQASGLDISARQAFYCVQIAKKAKTLGLTREQLKTIKVSKLKEIFSLELTEHEAEIRKLIEEAPGLSLAEVQHRVRELKGQGDVLYLTLKLEKAIKETLDNAMELARQNYGSVVNDGEVTEISDSKAMELILVSFLQDVNNQAGTDQLSAEGGIEVETE